MCDRPEPPIRTRKTKYSVEVDSKIFIISKDSIYWDTQRHFPAVIMYSVDHFNLDEGVRLRDVSLNDRLCHIFFKYNLVGSNKLERLCCVSKNEFHLGIDR